MRTGTSCGLLLLSEHCVSQSDIGTQAHRRHFSTRNALNGLRTEPSAQGDSDPLSALFAEPYSDEVEFVHGGILDVFVPTNKTHKSRTTPYSLGHE